MRWRGRSSCLDRLTKRADDAAALAGALAAATAQRQALHQRATALQLALAQDDAPPRRLGRDAGRNRASRKPSTGAGRS